jgi:putative FmdB family regulatory protein
MLQEIRTMPLYEYQCTACGEIEEAIQKFSDAPLTRCKHCSGKLNKLISQSSFHLKGTGWYVTDYAKKSGSAKKGKKSDTKSESTTTKENKSGTGRSDPTTAKSK